MCIGGNLSRLVSMRELSHQFTNAFYIKLPKTCYLLLKNLHLVTLNIRFERDGSAHVLMRYAHISFSNIEKHGH